MALHCEYHEKEKNKVLTHVHSVGYNICAVKLITKFVYQWFSLFLSRLLIHSNSVAVQGLQNMM